MFPLALLAEEEVAEIVGPSSDAGASGASRVEELGLRNGKTVRMLANRTGLVLVKFDDARIAVDRAIAMRIEVR